MPKRFDFEGEVYEFGDDVSDEEALAFIAEAPSPAPAPELARRPLGYPEFEPRLDVVMAGREAAEATALERAQSMAADPRLSPAEQQEAVQAEYRKRRAAEMARQEQIREFVTRVGQGEPLRLATPPLVAPIFRPTRIRQAEVAGPTPTGEPLVERLYYDPSGEIRPPTAVEEAVEAFAQQPVMTEEQARARGAEIERQRRLTEEARERGEEPPEFEAPESAITGVMSRKAGTGAVYESPLAATLRSVPAWLENTFGSIMYGALGYEANPETGEPIDPEDLGYKLSQVREFVGLPETVSNRDTFRLATTVPRLIGKAAELGGVDTVTRAFDWVDDKIPLAVAPLPGGATTREQRKETTFDPAGLRTASDDPNVLVALARDVAVGRGLGDEFRDSPAVASQMAEAYGDEDAAWVVGTIGSMALPAGPGTAARVGRRVATPFLRGGGDALIKLADASNYRVLDSVADYVAALSDTPAADSRLVRRVAEQAVTADGILTEAQKADAIAAIREAPEVNTPEGLARVIGGAVGEPVGRQVLLPSDAPTKGRMLTRIVRNVPDSYTMVTDTIAAPTKLAPEIKRLTDQAVRRVFQRNEAQVVEGLADLGRRARDELGDAPLGQRLIDLAEQAERLGLEDAEAAARFARSAPVRNALADFARAHSDTPPDTFTALFYRSTPKEIAQKFAGSGRETPVTRLGRYDSWDDVPPQDLRLALEQVRAANARHYGRGASRSAFELSELQQYVSRADNPKLLDSRISRRVRAVGGKLAERAPLSVERAIEDIRASATSTYRQAGELLAGLAKELGSVEKALDEMVTLAARDVTPETVWKQVLGSIYQKDPATLWPRVEALFDGDVPMVTVQGLIDVDKALVAQRLVGSGWDRLTNASFVSSTLSKNNAQKALLKVYIEEGMRKAAARLGREFEGVTAGLTNPSGELELLRGLDGPTARAGSALPTPGPAGTEAARFFDDNITRHYDVAASDFERKLAENGEEFAALLDSVPVKERAGWGQFAKDLVTDGARFARNVIYGTRYGYGLPNLPLVLGRLVEAPILSVLTIGLDRTAAALAQAGRRLNPSAWKARRYGGVIEAPDGVVYTGDDITKLLDVYGLGASAIDTERVGSLANDLLVNARRVAKEQGKGAWAQRWLDAFNPATRSMGLRWAEAIELGFRRAVFESALAGGEPPAEAARLARRSQLDFGATPDVVSDYIGQLFATATANYQLLAEVADAVARNPSNVGRVLRLHRKRAQAADPYGLGGDKELTTLFTIPGEEQAFYGPTNPLFTPLGTGLNIAKNLNYVGATLLEAARRSGEGGGQYLAEGIGVTGEQAASDVLEKVYGALDIIGGIDEGGMYDPGAVNVESLTDEQTFLATYLLADAVDPDRQRGVFESMHAMLDPVYVKPPPEDALVVYDREGKPSRSTLYWGTQPPEGVAYIRVKGNEATGGKDGLQVIKPSNRGIRAIKALRALPLAEPTDTALRLGAALEPAGRDLAEALGFETTEGVMVPGPALPQGLPGVVGAVTPLTTAPTGLEAREARVAAQLAEAAGSQTR
jgi:hypothetical protein